MSLRFNTIAAIAAAAGLATSFSSDAHAQLFTWVNPLGGSWSDASSWSPSIVPNGPGQSASLSSGEYTVQLDQDVTLDGLAIAEGAELALNSSTFEIGASGVESSGTLSITGGDEFAGILLARESLALQGVGETLLLTEYYAARIIAADGESLTIGPSHTIRGAGGLGGTIINYGTILSGLGNGYLVLQGPQFTNRGEVRASPDTYGIYIHELCDVDNYGGEIIADNAPIDLAHGSHVRGGVIRTIGTGIVRALGFRARELSDITLDGRLQFDHYTNISLNGMITNNGTLLFEPQRSHMFTEVTIAGGATLGGSGELVVGTTRSWNDTGREAMWFEDGSTHGSEHLIRGSGTVSGSFTNLGTIAADSAEPLRLSPDVGDGRHIKNLGQIVAREGCVLELAGPWRSSGLIEQRVDGTTDKQDTPTGKIIADGGVILIPEDRWAAVSSGGLTANGDGRVVVDGALSLDHVELHAPIELGPDGHLGMSDMDITQPIHFRDGGEVILLDCDIEHPLVIVPNASLVLSRYLSKHREITLAADLHAASASGQKHPSIGWASGLRLSGNSTIHINGSPEPIPPDQPQMLDIGPSRFDAVLPFDPCVLGPGMIISGSGRIGLGLEVEGLITADDPGEHLVLENDYARSSVYNFGTISAISANTEESGTIVELDMYGLFQDIEWCGDDFPAAPPCSPSTGVLLADGPNARVVLKGDTVVYYGSIRTADGGRLEIPSGSAPGVANLNMDAEVNVRAGGTLYLDSGCTIADDLCPTMEVTNNGIITLHDHEAGSSAALFTDHGTILQGSGEIRCGRGSLVGIQLRPGQPDFRYDRWIDFGPDQTLTGSGHILGHFINRGTISVGLDDHASDDARIGAMTAENLLTLTDSSRLHLDLLDADTFESIDSTGTIELGGALHVNALHPDTLAAPSRFPILTAATITGRFDSTDLPDGTAFTWHVLYLPDRVELLATCDADINSTGAAPGSTAWGEPDGVLNADDLTLFVERWLARDPVADLTTMGSTPSDPAFYIPDGVVTVQDLTFFVELWIAGCP
ncbi:MAG: GC-type dockerin domain-anchored protein [Planctomycetota bacterium]